MAARADAVDAFVRRDVRLEPSSCHAAARAWRSGSDRRGSMTSTRPRRRPDGASTGSAEHARPYWHNSATGETTWERLARRSRAAADGRGPLARAGDRRWREPAPLETDLSRVREVVVGGAPLLSRRTPARARHRRRREPRSSAEGRGPPRVREIVVGESPEAELEREVAQRKAAQAERAAAARAEWSEYWAEEYGLPYWHNSRTGETTYDRPEGLAPTRAAAAARRRRSRRRRSRRRSRRRPRAALAAAGDIEGAAAKQVEGYPDLIWPAPAPTRQPEIAAGRGASGEGRLGKAREADRVQGGAEARARAEAAAAAASPAAAAATVPRSGGRSAGSSRSRRRCSTARSPATSASIRSGSPRPTLCLASSPRRR